MSYWKLKTRCIEPIGLDIGHDSIKMIQLETDGSKVRVLAAGRARIPVEIRGDEASKISFVTDKVREMLADRPFHGRDVVSCLPSDKLRITSLRLGESGSEQIERALSKEMNQRFGLDPELDSMDYLVAGSVRQGEELKNELILFAADSETIENHIRLLEDCGLRPAAIDPAPCALFRSFERSLRRQEDRERTVVFIDLGSTATTVVFGDMGDISFVKKIPTGGERFNREIGLKLGVEAGEVERLRDMLRSDKEDSKVDPATRQVIVDTIGSIGEELAKEIALCLRYYTVTFRGMRLEKAVFTGGEAYEGILMNVLKRQLPVEVELARPLKGFDLSNVGADMDSWNDRRGVMCEWAVAAGLGLKIHHRSMERSVKV
mgnify:CR=1 FL=1